MNSNKFEKCLNYIPKILDNSLEINENFDMILDVLKNLFNYNFAFIAYINSNRINIKKVKSNTKIKIKENDFIDISEDIRRELFSPETVYVERASKLAKELTLNTYKSKYLISKLIIRDTVFGFIVVAKDLDKNFDIEDKDILKSISSICSYSIKDSELSGVFKMQLKSLQDAIIEKSEANRIIQEQNEKILSADKIKNEFLANISHELRTPLTSIIGFAEILDNGFYGQLNEKQKKYVSDIQASGVHLLGMINEILDISKIEAKAMKLNILEFDLIQNLTEVSNIVKPLLNKKNLSFKTVFEENCFIQADYQKIQQIFYNLLSNAIKYTEENGKIEIGFKTDNKKVTIWVKDNGIGIAKKYHGKIFGKFVQLGNTLTKTESSTGLGLTITKELVQLHNGKISLESVVNKGTTFFVEIPLKYKPRKRKSIV